MLSQVLLLCFRITDPTQLPKNIAERTMALEREVRLPTIPFNSLSPKVSRGPNHSIVPMCSLIIIIILSLPTCCSEYPSAARLREGDLS